MKILLDEGVPEELAGHFAGHDVLHVVDIGWRGVSNGKLMRLIAGAGFEVFLTLVKNQSFQ